MKSLQRPAWPEQVGKTGEEGGRTSLCRASWAMAGVLPFPEKQWEGIEGAELGE